MKDKHFIPSLFNYALEESNSPHYSRDNKKEISIFLINDFFADADSIGSAVDLLIALKRKEVNYPNVKFNTTFISSDEFNNKTLESAWKYYDEKKESFLQNIYGEQLKNTSWDIQPGSSLPFRIQDAATVLFPLADILGIDITLIPGDVRETQNNFIENKKLSIQIKENSNPYFGSFGKDFGNEEKKYIDRITKYNEGKNVNEWANQIFIEKVEEAQKKSSVFIINGGSLALLSHLSENIKIAKNVNVIMLAFNQPIFKIPGYSTTYSHNDSLNVSATEKFLENSVRFNSVEVIDSNTCYYCPSFSPHKEMKKEYKTYISDMGLKNIISAKALENLFSTEYNHFTKYGLNKKDHSSSYFTKFNDSMMVAYLTGDIIIPMVSSFWNRLGPKEITNKEGKKEVNTILSMVPSSSDSGIKLTMPYLKTEEYEGHPFSGSTTVDNVPVDLTKKNIELFITSLTAFFNSQAEYLKHYVKNLDTRQNTINLTEKVGPITHSLGREPTNTTASSNWTDKVIQRGNSSVNRSKN